MNYRNFHMPASWYTPDEEEQDALTAFCESHSTNVIAITSYGEDGEPCLGFSLVIDGVPEAAGFDPSWDTMREVDSAGDLALEDHANAWAGY